MTESIPSATVEVEFGGRKFTFSPLSLLELQQIEVLEERVASGKVSVRDSLLERAKKIHSSALRNDPDVLLDDVLDSLTFKNIAPVWLKLLEVSGLAMPAPGEEMPAVDSGSTGPSSTV
jgi:hypothetical protein